MIAQYFFLNFSTLMILLGLASFMFADRDVKIPATKLFAASIFIMLTITVAVTLNASLDIEGLDPAQAANIIKLRTITTAVSYILRPFLILMEILIILSSRKLKIICTIPAVINGIYYSTAIFGSRIAFYINENNQWVAGKFHLTIYITNILYLLILLCISVHSFRAGERNRSIVLITMIVQAVFVAFREYYNIDPSYTDEITVLCILEYYIYLSSVYRQELTEKLSQKEIELKKKELDVLRGQIQPHFIYNTLNIIRSLARTNSPETVGAINSFTKYLRTHINALQSEDMIPIEKELENVKVYTDLAQTDHPGKTEMIYDLRETGFMIPALSLEPIIENAIQHGISRKGGTIRVSSFSDENSIFVRVSDDGSAKKDLTDKNIERLGVGLENTRKRLEIQCGGTLSSDITDSGCTVTITIPKERSNRIENTYSR